MRLFGVSPIRRWAYQPALKGLKGGLAPVTVLRGPRQVGKTTLLNQVIETLLDEGVDPARIFRIQFDDIPELQRLSSPILDLVGVNHFPERGPEPEVDYVLTVGDQRIPVEIKYRRRVDHADTRGLRAFIEKSVYNAPFGVLVTLNDDLHVDDPRIVSLPLSTLLLMR